MDVEDFRKSVSYKQAMNAKKLSTLEREFIIKKAELNSLYKKLEKLHDKRMILEERKEACMEALFNITSMIKNIKD